MTLQDMTPLLPGQNIELEVFSFSVETINAEDHIKGEVMAEKRVYVSDVHMGAGRKPGNGRHDYDWLSENEADVFAGFLLNLDKDKDITEVILLGDTMDNWVCPIDEEPPKFQEIIDASKNASLKTAFKTLAASESTKLVYLPGNHDMLITRQELEDNFPGIVYGGSAAFKSVYRTSRLLAEHGSSYALFNAPDPNNDPRTRLPLGYFISRVAATKHARTGSAKRHYATYIDDILELLGPQTLPQSVFEAVLEECDIPDDAEIVMPPVGGKKVSVPVTQIKTGYANLYEQWKERQGPGMAFKAVMAEIGYLGDLADHLCKKGGTNIVIFGHSHDAELDKDKWFVDDRIYANCGAWCDEDKKRTFIETEKQSKAYVVRLMSWNRGDDGKWSAKMEKEETISL